jgi:hypothetical protein
LASKIRKPEAVIFTILKKYSYRDLKVEKIGILLTLAFCLYVIFFNYEIQERIAMAGVYARAIHRDPQSARHNSLTNYS